MIDWSEPYNPLTSSFLPASGGKLGWAPLAEGSSVRALLAACSAADCLVKKGAAPTPGLGFLAYALAACVWSLSNIRKLAKAINSVRNLFWVWIRNRLLFLKWDRNQYFFFRQIRISLRKVCLELVQNSSNFNCVFLFLKLTLGWWNLRWSVQIRITSLFKRREKVPAN